VDQAAEPSLTGANANYRYVIMLIDLIAPALISGDGTAVKLSSPPGYLFCSPGVMGAYSRFFRPIMGR
jgi:hypothetical protein